MAGRASSGHRKPAPTARRPPSWRLPPGSCTPVRLGSPPAQRPRPIGPGSASQPLAGSECPMEFLPSPELQSSHRDLLSTREIVDVAKARFNLADSDPSNPRGEHGELDAAIPKGDPGGQTHGGSNPTDEVHRAHGGESGHNCAAPARPEWPAIQKFALEEYGQGEHRRNGKNGQPGRPHRAPRRDHRSRQLVTLGADPILSFSTSWTPVAHGRHEATPLRQKARACAAPARPRQRERCGA